MIIAYFGALGGVKKPRISGLTTDMAAPYLEEPLYAFWKNAGAGEDPPTQSKGMGGLQKDKGFWTSPCRREFGFRIQGVG